MITPQEYAELSALVYKDVRIGENINSIPFEWIEQRYVSNLDATGFSGGIYKNIGEIGTTAALIFERHSTLRPH